jgi:hypothetical protein
VIKNNQIVYDFNESNESIDLDININKPKNNMTKKQSRKGKQNKRRGSLVW